MTPPIVSIENVSFIVDNGRNRVNWDFLDGWFCTCEDFTYRHRECKHIRECKSNVKQDIVKCLDDVTCYDKLDKSSIQSKLAV